jgi:hypothetical protein
MDELARWLRNTLHALENINDNLERLVALKEHELGVTLEHGDGGPYVPRDLEE